MRLFKLALQFAQLTRTEGGAVATELAATRCAAPSVAVVMMVIVLLLLVLLMG